MDLKKYIIEDGVSILEAMNAINENSRGIVYVCKGRKLLGALSDGDIRRHILSGGELSALTGIVAGENCKFLSQNGTEDPDSFMIEQKITSIPIVDENKEIVAIKFLHEKCTYEYEELGIPVVIMAGGKGTRLKPFTNILPKPLIPIGDKTIVERIMDYFKAFGCETFKIIINYKRDFIKAYFEDKKMYNISFINEESFLGTAGGLKLIEGKIDSTFFMTNCDILIDEDYSKILKHHHESKAILTMVCSVRDYQIPYGTIELDNTGNVQNVVEKPNYSFLVNTGLYVIEPRFLNYIPENTFIHITDVIERCIAAGEKIAMYPVSESAWMDMGEFDEMHKMEKRISSDVE